MNIENAFKGTYKNKRVLVTGHTGFKGSWLTLVLTKLGANVLGYSLEPETSPNLFSACNLQSDIQHVIGDIRDEEKLNKVFETFKPEIVFHLAAQPLVRYSYKEPKLTYETNVMGTLNVLEAVRKENSVKVVVNITTDKCYENKEWVYGYRECDPMGGFDPYSSSKACSELITSAYRNSFFGQSEVALSSVRAGNVIGGGDWAEDRLIPDCVRSLSNNETIIIRNPIAIRPWEHVLEPLSGYLWLGALMWENGQKYSSAWNFGPGDEGVLNVEEVVKSVINFWESGSYKIDSGKHPHEATLLKLDISKSNYILNWKPVYNVSYAIEETIKWYKNFYDLNPTDIKEFTNNQIDSYVKAARLKNLAWSG